MLNINRRSSSLVDSVAHYKALIGVLVFVVGFFGTFSILSLMKPGLLDNGGKFFAKLYPSVRTTDSESGEGSRTSGQQTEQQNSSSGKSDPRPADSSPSAGGDANIVQPAAHIPQSAAGSGSVSQQPTGGVQSSAPKAGSNSAGPTPVASGGTGVAATGGTSSAWQPPAPAAPAATPAWQPSTPPAPAPPTSTPEPSSQAPLLNLVTGLVKGLLSPTT